MSLESGKIGERHWGRRTIWKVILKRPKTSQTWWKTYINIYGFQKLGELKQQIQRTPCLDTETLKLNCCKPKMKKTLKAAREKWNITQRRAMTWMTTVLESQKTLKQHLQVLKQKYCELRSLYYPVKIFSGEITTFSNEGKLRKLWSADLPTKKCWRNFCVTKRKDPKGKPTCSGMKEEQEKM